MNSIASQFAQVNDAGIQLIVQFVDQDNVIIDLAGASALKIKIGSPDGNTTDKSAALLTDGTDGKIFYTTSSSDLTEAGYYEIQGQASIGGSVFSTRVGILQVNANVDNT